MHRRLQIVSAVSYSEYLREIISCMVVVFEVSSRARGTLLSIGRYDSVRRTRIVHCLHLLTTYQWVRIGHYCTVLRTCVWFAGKLHEFVAECVRRSWALMQSNNQHRSKSGVYVPRYELLGVTVGEGVVCVSIWESLSISPGIFGCWDRRRIASF